MQKRPWRPVLQFVAGHKWHGIEGIHRGQK